MNSDGLKKFELSNFKGNYCRSFDIFLEKSKNLGIKRSFSEVFFVSTSLNGIFLIFIHFQLKIEKNTGDIFYRDVYSTVEQIQIFMHCSRIMRCSKV